MQGYIRCHRTVHMHMHMHMHMYMSHVTCQHVMRVCHVCIRTRTRTHLGGREQPHLTQQRGDGIGQ